METSICPLEAQYLEVTGGGLIDSFLAGRSGQTLRAYRADLEDFRTFMGARTADEAGQVLFQRGHGRANGVALAYRASLIDRGLQAATVNRRLAALRSLVKLARTMGLVSWSLEVENMKAESYRDTRGPGRQGFRGLTEEAGRRNDPKGFRDRAAIRLMYDLALRRAEVVGIDLADVDLESGTVAIISKGRTQKERLTLPAATRAAVAAWIEARGQEAGPLFVNFDRAGKGERLTGTGLYVVVRTLGKKIGLTVRPHGLRHAGITQALDLTNGNVRMVQRYSRHRDIRTLQRYDDNRADFGGEIARLVAANA